MDWSDVRNLYPNQFVKLKILAAQIEKDKEVIKDVAVIRPVSNAEATKELLHSKGDEVVYHTVHKQIILEVRQDVG
ncbi:hypothetical protein [Oceanobacillus timonensis]|uniref:hypothetical protein n=1 Tax=Oceanobacillus timonensis TaxID=1926285 RepID=UPI0009BB7B24|nr:hypothetical protein [Oceanobacillus timonensis]